MEIERKYDQIIYNICQLIKKHKYKRAIATAQHLINNGFPHNQVLVLKSYATSKLQGHTKALETLHSHSGPLVQMAKAQYNQSLSLFQQAQLFFNKLVVQGKPAIIDLLAKSNSICLTGEGELDLEVDKNRVRLVSKNRQEEFVEGINQVTRSYISSKNKKEKEQLSGEQYIRNCQNCIKEYQNLIQEYRPKKQIKMLIENFLVYLQKI